MGRLILRRKPRNRLRAVFLPYRDREPANALAPSGKSTEFCGDQEISFSAELRGGGCSPDRTSLHVKFPANREKNRQFLEIGPDKEIFAGIRGAKSIRCGQIPYATDQGTNLSKQGKDYPFQQRTGNAVAQKDDTC